MTNFGIWFFACLISTLGVSYLFLKLSNTKLTFSLKILLVYLFATIGITLIKYFRISILSYLAYFFFQPILFSNLKKMPLKKTFYYVIFIWFCGILFDLISMLLASLICKYFHINMDKYYILFCILLSFFVFICFFILGNIKIFIKSINKIIDKLLKVPFLDIIIILFSFFILSIAIIMFLNLKDLNIDFLLIIIIILIVVTFIVLIYHKLNYVEITKYLKMLKNNNDFYIEIENEHRIFKHNLIAKLLSIKSVSNQKSSSLIDDIIHEFTKSIELSKKIEQIPYGLNGLIYQTVHPYIDKLNISITNSIKYDILEHLKPRRYNVFIEKIIITLNNAIEASLKSSNKILTITIYEEKDLIIIEIKNSFSDILNIDTIGNNGYSTKNKKRGLGLFSAFRNNEASIEIKIINNFFISKITAKKKKV